LSKIRIASFIASATEIVDALGMLDSLVGRSHECDYPHGIEALPVCTRPKIEVTGNSLEIDQQVKANLTNALSIYEVLDDVLEQIQPTHILTQTQCEVCAVSLKDVERSVASRLKSQPKIVSLQPNCLADIWDDIRSVAESLEIRERGETLIQTLQTRMQIISGQATTKKPTVACIEWLSPLMAAGNWVPELVEMAGGVNLFGEAGKHSPWMTWEELVAKDPDVIIAMPCGFDEARTRSEIYWLTNHEEFANLKAARTNQVHTVDGNQYFNRPGPRVVDSLQILSNLVKSASPGDAGPESFA
jgi:iron complex transport system substrate-binding protein